MNVGSQPYTFPKLFDHAQLGHLSPPILFVPIVGHDHTPNLPPSFQHVLNFHLKSKYYKSNQGFQLSFDSFKLTFQCMPHLSTSGVSMMVFEHLWDYFHLEDLGSGFHKLFQLCFHIA